MSKNMTKRDKHEIQTSTAEQIQHSGSAYSPDVDIFMRDHDLVFSVDLPGVAVGDTSIEVDETDSLVIRAKNSFKESGDLVLQQYAVGDYYRAFQLSSDYDKSNISAKLENGRLELVIPKKEEAKPRKIEISA